MRRIDAPRAFICSSCASTCACTVTSSAVVGSSAITMSGSSAIADAISARWRRPPESWSGRCRARSAGFGHAHAREQLEHLAVAGRAVVPAVQAQRLGDLGADRAQGVERDERVLQDESDIPARAPGATRARRSSRDVLAVQLQFARLDDRPAAGEADEGCAP